MYKSLFIFSFMFLGLSGLSAQNETRFYVSADPLQVAVGEPVEVTFTLENGKSNQKLTPPDWEAAGFVLLSTSQSSNISISNGQTTVGATYVYVVTPAEAGVYTIPSVSIQTNGKELRSEALTITADSDTGATPNRIKPGNSRKLPVQPKPDPRKQIKTIRM